MSKIDISKSPYLDRFKPDKDWVQVLVRPDRRAQAAEVTEAQSILHHYLGRLGNSLFEDGGVLSDMTYIISEDKTEITVEEGRVFLGGKVRDFYKQTVPFSEDGRFDLGVKLKQTIITSAEDESLLDQATGTPSYNSPGADRLVEEVILTGNDDEAPTIYQFRDGELFIQSQKPEISRINDILAKRTFDESGSYKVRGFEIYIEEDPDNENRLFFAVDPGLAYILGYQVEKPSTSRVSIPKARETREILSEGFHYSSETREGRLGSYPVASVNRVTGQVRVTRQLVTRGSVPNGRDTLPHSAVFEVARVWTESGGEVTQEYERGTDFQLVNGNAIDWGPAGNEPNTGATYYVTYNYNRTMRLDTDYSLREEGEGDRIATYIDFNGLTGAKPIVGSLVTVDYEYYLARKDLAIMDKDGEVTIKQGEPGNLDNLSIPSHDDPYTLILGAITIYPNSATYKPEMSTLTRLTMEDLQKMKTRVDNLEYNDAVNALDQPAMAGINPMNLRGVFSDGFISMEKADLTHPDMTAAFSFEDASITLPYSDITLRKPSLLANSSHAHVWGRLVTAPFDEVKSISQPRATNTFNVNPYNVYNNRAMMTLNPSEDNWIEEDHIIIMEEDTDYMKLRRWWAHPGKYLDSKAIMSTIRLDPDQPEWEDGGWSYDIKHGRTGTRLEAGGTRTIESAVEFMRQIDISFEAQNLLPNTNNLYILFDGIRRPITPASGFSSGSENGTIRSNAEGHAKGTFTVPAGVRTGTRQVFLQNDTNAATTTYIAQGTRKTVEETIIRTHVTIDLFDPLAQSFQFPTNQVVTSFGVYFASKSNTKNVSFQVRGISEGGSPNKTVYASSTLTPSQVKVSDDASLETKVVFDDPLVIDAGKEYALVILTDTDQYTMWVGTLGEDDVVTGNTVTSNPYITGVLYSSSNASAWTPHQESDLKFNVYTADFNDEAVLEFDVIEEIQADSILLMATYLTPENTGCTWDAKIVMDNEPLDTSINDKPWVPIQNYTDIEVGQVARLVKLRATFKANRNMSPLLSLHDITLTTFLTDLQGSYISRNIDAGEAPFNNIRMQYEAFEPGGTSVTPQFSFDGGTTWQNFTTQPGVSNSDGEYNVFLYEERIAEGNQLEDEIKFRLNMESQNSFIRPRARKLITSFTEI